jgi:hypothetical protein
MTIERSGGAATRGSRWPEHLELRAFFPPQKAIEIRRVSCGGQDHAGTQQVCQIRVSVGPPSTPRPPRSYSCSRRAKRLTCGESMHSSNDSHRRAKRLQCECDRCELPDMRRTIAATRSRRVTSPTTGTGGLGERQAGTQEGDRENNYKCGRPRRPSSTRTWFVDGSQLAGARVVGDSNPAIALTQRLPRALA